jgi:hypothetical protein
MLRATCGRRAAARPRPRRAILSWGRWSWWRPSYSSGRRSGNRSPTGRGFQNPIATDGSPRSRGRVPHPRSRRPPCTVRTRRRIVLLHCFPDPGHGHNRDRAGSLPPGEGDPPIHVKPPSGSREQGCTQGRARPIPVTRRLRGGLMSAPGPASRVSLEWAESLDSGRTDEIFGPPTSQGRDP